MNNRMTPAFLTKVALAWPSTSARGFATSWRDLVGVGESGCSRPTISKVKDAFAEVCKRMSVEHVKNAACVAAAQASAAVVAPGRLPLPCCASHQSNVAIAAAVSGCAALAGARCSAAVRASSTFWAASAASGFAPRSVCGAIVRLFKYLMCAYAADFGLWDAWSN